MKTFCMMHCLSSNTQRYPGADNPESVRNSRVGAKPFQRSQKGVALVVVLVVTAVALALLTTLIYMITTGTQISGMQKRYKTALEAGYGAADITFQMIALRGDIDAYRTSLATAGIAATPSPTLVSSCTSSLGGTVYTQLAAKLMTATSSWSAGCDKSMKIDPANPASYDMMYVIGSGTRYNVYAKIVDATEGNSAGGGETLFNKGVVSANSGEVMTMSMPYLYTIEVDAESATNDAERAKLTILYQY